MGYQEILAQVEQLPPEEQLLLLEKMILLLKRYIVPDASRSILELQGVGKELWQGQDAQDYVHLERNSWSG